MNDREVVNTFIRKHNFGLLVTTDGKTIDETLTPFLISETEECLYGHIARANPQWTKWDDSTIAKVMFTGPHSYISPKFYESELNVPTWNYTAVSISGEIKTQNNRPEIIEFLDALVTQHEAPEAPWNLDKDDERYMKLLDGIVVFRLQIKDVEASYKLNQNKKVEDQLSVIAALESSDNPIDNEVAKMMKQNI